MRKASDYQWLEALRESLGANSDSAQVLIATSDGARHIEMSRRDIDRLLADHDRRIKGQKRLFIWVITMVLIALMATGANYFLLSGQYAQRSGEYQQLTNALDELLYTARSDTTLPISLDPNDLERNVRELSSVLAYTDQAFRIYVESTRPLLGERRQALQESLGSAGFELERVQQVMQESQPVGGMLVDREISRILDLYLDDPIYNELEALSMLDTFADSLPNARPVVAGRVTSPFGMRRHPVTGRFAPHRGVDFVSYEDRNILAAGAGRVSFAARDGGFGKVVIVDHGMGIESLYAHLASFDVEEGQWVEKGDQLGVMGATGRTSGIHLHYEVRFNGRYLDPLKVFEVGSYVR